MKRKILALVLAVVLIALLSAGSYAYFAAEGTATNSISSGSVTIAVHTKGGDGAEMPSSGVSILPGDTVKETLTVENTGKHPAWVRVSVTAAVENSDLTAAGCLIPNVNTTDWTEKDGWYYYNRELKGGETTEPLFTEVYFDGLSIDNQYLGKTFTLELKSDAVQSENNGTSALDAAGWPA